MQPSPRCASHPERQADRICARCGTFVCPGCLVSGDLCVPCKTLLMKQGVPYSAQEKARAAARRLLRLGTWMVRLVFSTGGACSVVLFGGAAGYFPPSARVLGLILGGLSTLFGLGAVVSGVWALERSQRGRPGPAVDGVVPVSSGLLLLGIGLVPLIGAMPVWVRWGGGS